MALLSGETVTILTPIWPPFDVPVPPGQSGRQHQQQGRVRAVRRSMVW